MIIIGVGETWSASLDSILEVSTKEKIILVVKTV